MSDIDTSINTFPDFRRANDMPVLDAALFYAGAGFRVIMLEPWGKAPHLHVRQGWVHRATRDETTLTDWFTRCPDANIGILPDKGERPWVILDLDIKEGARNGVTEFTGLHEHAVGPTARSASGGVHRLFQGTDDPRLRNMSPRGGGFDLMVRSRQIVVAPSKIRSGNDVLRYRWTQGGRPAPIPRGVIDRACEIAAKTGLRENDPIDAPRIPDLAGCEAIAFSHELDTGDRSHGAFDLARHLYLFHGDRSDAEILATVWSVPAFSAAALDRRITQDSALEWLWQYCVWPARANRLLMPGDDEYDPRPVMLRDDDHGGVAPWETSQRASGDALVDALSNIPTISELAKKYAAPPEFVLPGWLPKGVVTTLYGKDGTGKTMFVQRMCTALAAGRSTMGRPAGSPVRCLLVLTEDTAEAIVDRQRRICRDLAVSYSELADTLHIPPDLMNADVKMIQFDRDLRASPTPFLHAVEDYIEQHSPEVVVLDPISDIYADEENRREKVSQFMRLINRLAYQYNIAVLLIGHPAKASESEYSGSGAWSSKSRSRWLMAADNDRAGAPVTLFNRKVSYGRRPEDVTLLWSEDGVLREVTEKEESAYVNEMFKDTKDLIYAFIQQGTLLGEAYKTSPRSPLYLPRIMVDRDATGGKTEAEIERVLIMCIKSGELVPNATFGRKYGRPNVKSSDGRRLATGIWFAEKPERDQHPGITDEDVRAWIESPPDW